MAGRTVLDRSSGRLMAAGCVSVPLTDPTRVQKTTVSEIPTTWLNKD